VVDDWPSSEEVKRSVQSGLARLVSNDWQLFYLDVNERSITHKWATYLEVEFNGWDVECEYNRMGEDPKRMYKGITRPYANDTSGRTVFPDIIVHHRDSEENLPVIEAKKSSASLALQT
jgi:hypothetical protein